MRLLVLVMGCVLASCSGGGGSSDGGTGGGSAGGTGGAGGGSGGSGGGDAGTPVTPWTVTGALTATIQSSGPVAAYQTSTNLSGLQFATTPASANPGISVGVSKQGQLTAGMLNTSTPGFSCAISVTDNANVWLTAVSADGGMSAGTCSVDITSVTVRFMAVDGISYAVHGTMNATATSTSLGPVTLSASF